MLEKLRDILMRDEGFRAKVYDDANGLLIGPTHTLVGHPTIGYGRALDRQGLSRKEAEYLLNNDILRCEADASRNFDWWPSLADARKVVVISMIFNLGLEGFKDFRKMILAISQGRFGTAADEMEKSRWSKQVGNRDIELVTMMRQGK